MDAPQVLSLIGAITALVVAIAGILRNRDDHKRGIRSENRADLTAGNALYSQILDDVREHQVDPLRREVAELRERLDRVQAESRGWRARYWAALDYLAAIIRWLTGIVPADISDMPTIPDELRDDLRERA